MNTDYRLLNKSDIFAVEQILASCNLPYEDISNYIEKFIAAEIEGKIVGVVGLEVHGKYGLFRSLAVKEQYRNNGIGEKLISYMIDQARQMHIETLYLLTMTAEKFFIQKEFQIIDRNLVPIEISETKEFQSLCPIAAKTMIRVI